MRNQEELSGNTVEKIFLATVRAALAVPFFVFLSPLAQSSVKFEPNDAFRGPTMVKPALERAVPIEQTDLQCLGANTIEQIRVAPEEAPHAFESCLPELQKKFADWHLSDAGLAAIFFSVIANRMAPYGSSEALSENAIRRERTLNCANYTALTAYLFRRYSPRGEPMKFIGFVGGAIGNHVQIEFRDRNTELLLDPTIGLVANVRLESVLLRQPASSSDLRYFPSKGDLEISEFRNTVVTALLEGKYRQSDVLYSATGLPNYLKLQREALQLIQANNPDGLRDLFPSPAGNRLADDVSKRF